MYEMRRYTDEYLDDVILAWKMTQPLAHPFLPEDFQKQELISIETIYLPNADTWVIANDERAVGFIALIGNEVGGLFLHPSYHGQGFGNLMMDHAAELHKKIVLDVFEKNVIGRGFYASYGFKQIERKTHEPTGEAVLRLEYVV